MKERPILFRGEMIRAILDGSKTQTRRILSPQPDSRCNHVGGFKFCTGDHHRSDGCEGDIELPCKYGITGDRLWVRETWTQCAEVIKGLHLRFRADKDRPEWKGLWRPSIFMPRWASRITLEITEVRIQRVQEIIEADARAEGAEPVQCWELIDPSKGYRSYREGFRKLWDSINSKRGFGWDTNPWVWAITFKRL